jgi:hypothetical protein
MHEREMLWAVSLAIASAGCSAPAPQAHSADARAAPLYIRIDPRRTGEVWSGDEQRWLAAEWICSGNSNHGTASYELEGFVFVEFSGPPIHGTWDYRVLDPQYFIIDTTKPYPRTPGPPDVGCRLLRVGDEPEPPIVYADDAGRVRR